MFFNILGVCCGVCLSKGLCKVNVCVYKFFKCVFKCGVSDDGCFRFRGGFGFLAFVGVGVVVFVGFVFY